jgi:serine/threonine protein kinase
VEYVRDGEYPAIDTAPLPMEAALMPTVDGPGLPLVPAQVDRLEAAFPQLVEGVAALHRAGSIHRDLKPSNVLVSSSGRVVLLDFGLVLDIGGDRTLQSLQVAGTPAYMSPEQAAGLPLTAASDWYSVGVMLFQCLTGELPFFGTFLELIAAKKSAEAPQPSRFVSGVPGHLDSLCRDLLHRDAASRPGSEEILARLGNSSASAARVTPAPARTSPATLFIGREREMTGCGRPSIRCWRERASRSVCTVCRASERPRWRATFSTSFVRNIPRQ